MQYDALLGGKCLRSFLVYVAGHMLDVGINTLDAPVTAVECIHAYSLIHDDLLAIDDDDLCHGLSICHVKFGGASAILVGDASQTLVFSVLGDADMSEMSDRGRILMIFRLASANGIARMCGGQALDLGTKGKRVSLDTFEHIHRHKAGTLIHAVVRLSALNAGDKRCRTLLVLDKCAGSIGPAFQVQDDILDVVGDTATLGERQGADQQPGKDTCPTPLGFEQARKKTRDLIDDAHQSLEQLAEQSLDTSAPGALADYVIQCNK